MAKILFLAANARNTVRLDLGGEVRDVKDEIAKAGARAAFPVETEFAVLPEQLQSLLQLHKPHVLHFSGHGLGRDDPGGLQRREATRELLPEGDSPASAGELTGSALVLVTKGGAAVAVRPEAFTKLLEIVIEQSIAPLSCVVLNACFSAKQAQGVAQHIDCVIGMKRAVGDASAVAFAVGFYRAVAMGRSVKAAFDLGCNEIDIRGLPDKDVPTTFIRPGVELDKLFLAPEIVKLPGGPWLLRAALVVAALLCVLAGVAVFWAPGSGAPQRGTIVVAGPWLTSSVAREARQKLCEALEKARQEGEPQIQCLARPLIGAGDEALHKKALEAGAVLLLLIDREGAARLRPLGTLAGHEVFDLALPRIEHADAVAQPLAENTLSLAHVVQFREDDKRLKLDRLRCTHVDKTTPQSITILSLLTAMFAPGCHPSGVNLRMLADHCGAEHGDVCRLARLLYVRSAPSSPEDAKLLDASKRIQATVALASARAACTAGKAEEAMQPMKELQESQACVRLTATIAAACILSEQKGEHAERDAALREIEALADNKEEIARCTAPQRDDILAGVLAERAFWRARRGPSAWDAAAADYEAAWSIKRDYAHRLSFVELLLSRKQTVDEARRKLKELVDDTSLSPKERVHEALLSFVSALNAGDKSGVEVQKSRLLSAYQDQKLPLGERVFKDDNDKILKPLVCPDPAALCALTFLASPKTSASENLLKQALDASRVPPKPGAP